MEEFGTPINDIYPKFVNRYRAKLGLPQIFICNGFTYFGGRKRGYGFIIKMGYDEFQGLYMKEKYVFIPYYGQDEKELVNQAKEKQRELNDNYR